MLSVNKVKGKLNQIVPCLIIFVFTVGFILSSSKPYLSIVGFILIASIWKKYDWARKIVVFLSISTMTLLIFLFWPPFTLPRDGLLFQFDNESIRVLLFVLLEVLCLIQLYFLRRKF